MANILNVYDTVYGNTREIAETIGRHISDSHAVITTDIKNLRDDLIIKADIFIIGSPIHYWRATAKTNDLFIKIYKNRITERIGIIYDTRLEGFLAGNAVAKMLKMLYTLRFTMMGRGESFYMESTKGPMKLGEVAKSERFARQISEYVDGAQIDKVHTAGFVL